MNPMMMMLPMMFQMMQGMGKGGMGGQDAQFSSTYGPGALNTLENVQNQVNQMGGKGTGDITQNQNYQSGQNWLQGLFNDPQFFNQFEAPIMRQFEEQTLPGLNARYAGSGTHGSQGSTSFNRNLAREASTLHEKIAALRGGMQQQGANQALQYAQQPTSNYMQMLQQAMTPTQNQYQPATAGFFGDLISSLAGGAAKGYGQQWGESMVPSAAGGTPGGGLPTNISLGGNR